MGSVTHSAAEHVLADLAVRLGAAQVKGWSPAERDLAAAAAASAAPPERDDGPPGRGNGLPWRGDGLPGLDGIGRLRARIRAGGDPLGEAFCLIRSPGQRRSAGQTFTPGPVIESMVSWAGRTVTPARVID